MVLRDGEELDEADITAFCKAHIAGYKCPGSYEAPDMGSSSRTS